MKQADILLELNNISKTFASVQALKNVGFSVEKGVVHALMGENGAGKSTLIKILAGVYQPDEGAHIKVEGQEVGVLDPLTAVKYGIAVTYQDFSLFPNLTVMENIAISAQVEKNKKVLNWKQMRQTAEAAMQRIGISIDLDLQLGTLSAAKQQLVAICRALVYDAKLLILDEPTSTLSSNEVRNLFEIIRKLRSEGMAILFISHKLDEVFEISDRITILRDGTYVGTYEAADVTADDIISYMVGRPVQYTRNAPKAPSDKPVLEVSGLNKKGNYADISFKLYKGEILAFTGLVGAGRTELCQSIYGITQPDSGTILLDGKTLRVSCPEDATRKGIAFVPEDRRTQGLVTRKSVGQNISISVLRSLKNRLGLIDRKKEKTLVTKYVDQLKIKPPLPELEAANLSGGNQQRVVIAKCLALNPKVLIIDEPTNGIDIGAKQEIHNLLRELAEQGMAIIMISSELPEAISIANRILVMRRGRITAEFPGETATQAGIMRKAIL